MIQNKTYWPQLEGLRGIAILMVVTLHFWHTFMSGMSTLPLTDMIGTRIYNLAYGVRIFFALSGFLIYSHLLDSGPMTRGRLATFYIRRLRRIFPAFLFFLAVYLGLVTIYGANNNGTPLTPLNLFGAITFLTPVIRLLRPDLLPSLQIIPGTWSLNPEMWFYALIPGALIVCNGKRWPLLIVLATLSPLWRAAMPPDVSFTVRFDLFAMSDPFIWGMLAARLQRSYPHPIAAKVAIAVGSALFITVCASMRGMPLVRDPEFATGLASALVIYGVTVSNGMAAAFLSHRLLVHFGKISYSLFLCHISVAWYLVTPLLEIIAIRSPLPRFLIAFGISLAISHWISVRIFTHVELPGLGRTPFRPVAARNAVIVLAIMLATPAVISIFPRNYSVDLLARDGKPGYSNAQGQNGWLTTAGFPEQLTINTLDFTATPQWTAVFFPLQQQTLAQSTGQPVLISAHVEAHGSGYRTCLGIYDGGRDECSTVITAGTEKTLTLSGIIQNPARFQAKINIFPKDKITNMNVDVKVTDIRVMAEPPR